MENKPYKPEHSIMASYAMLDILNIKMSFDEFLDFSQIAFNHVKPFCVTTKSICNVQEGGICDLPVDMKYIKAVSTQEGTYNRWNTVQTINYVHTTSEEVFELPSRVDSYKRVDKFGKSREDLSSPDNAVIGDYVDFKKINNSTLQVSPLLEGYEVYILSSTPYQDEEGFPLLTMKQVEALMYQVALLYAQKQMFKGCKKIDINFIQRQASVKTAQARVPEYISDNEWDELLNIATSFDRKSFNKDYRIQK